MFSNRYCCNLQEELVIPGDHRVIRPSRRRLSSRRTSIICIADQDLPAIACLLQRVEIESNQVIEKVVLDLSTENVYLRAEYIQCMSISASGPLSSRQSP